jgi:transposase
MEGNSESILEGAADCLLPDPNKVGLYLWTGDKHVPGTLDGIIGMIEYGMKKNPYSGDMYIFRTYSKQEIHVYRWAGDGWCIWKKKKKDYRKYYVPEENKENYVKITGMELHLMLKGINLWKQFPVYDGESMR